MFFAEYAHRLPDSSILSFQACQVTRKLASDSVGLDMVQCGHMNQPFFHHNELPAPTVSEPQAERRDQTADTPTRPIDDAAASRHLYTMTVDDVAGELSAYDLHRDTRTIQRWCKSGKLRSIIDHENGDRYLIDPGSLRDTVTALLEERDSHGPRHTTSSRPRHDGAGTWSRPGDDAAPQFQFTPRSISDSESDAPTEPATEAAASDASRDETATLKQKVAELEKEKAMLTVDKQVREQMVDYLKDNFQQMLDQALERTEKLGELQAENAQLRALLPQHTKRPPEASSPPVSEGEGSSSSQWPPHGDRSTVHRQYPDRPE